jgi:glycerol-3-phosphate acyltransferase PlsX
VARTIPAAGAQQVRLPIALDAMGADRGPEVLVAGALEAARSGVRLLLVGEQVSLAPHLHGRDLAGLGIELVESGSAIAMRGHASDVRRKPQASINVAMQLLKEGRAGAVVSMGHSGATMASALLTLGRLPGIERPAIMALLPSLRPSGICALLDVGANADVRPGYFPQWAKLASHYLQEVRGIRQPTVGLLSIGEEENKGSALVLEVHQLLKAARDISFYGNVEGRDLFRGVTDIVLTDGFTGNVVLKAIEGEVRVLFGWIREALSADSRAKLGALLVRPRLRALASQLDPSTFGASLLLGVQGLTYIGHGSADARATTNALRAAWQASGSGVMEQLRSLP